MKSTESIVQNDWTPQNLLGLQRAIRIAYNSVEDACNPERHPYYATKNRAYGVGYNRWLAVDYYLKHACESSWITGIEAQWIPLGGKGGLCALELRGTYTSVLAIHLKNPDETPRESDYRFDKRVSNEKYPLLEGFAEPEAANQLLNLLLVHGDKNAEFAELRAYDNPDQRGSYTAFSNNIMAGYPLPTFNDSEDIPEPDIALIDDGTRKQIPSLGT